MNTMKIGQNLSAIRLRHGLTQAELAEAADVTTSHIGHVENGSRGISLELVLKICRTLRATPNDLLAGEYETEEKKRWPCAFIRPIEAIRQGAVKKHCAFYGTQRQNLALNQETGLSERPPAPPDENIRRGISMQSLMSCLSFCNVHKKFTYHFAFNSWQPEQQS